MLSFRPKKIILFLLILSASFSVKGEEELDLEDLEIRVVRQRFVDKAGKFEVGLQFNNIVNQDFVNIFLGSVLFQYHFLHSFGMEIGGSYGFAMKSVDYEILRDKLYTIDLKRVNPNLLANVAFNWSPFYGKFQIFSGRLLYFDTFFSLGGGLTGVQLSYDHCNFNGNEADALQQTYLGWGGRAGLGQHYFITKNHSIRWDFKVNFYMMDNALGECGIPEPGQEVVSALSLQQNYLIKIGYSLFL